MATPFKGKIELDVRDSTPDWEPFTPPRPPEGAPNVLIVLYDDTGLAAWSPFGGRINMPTLQKLADDGLMYSQWHTTALCSPTRSMLPDRAQPPPERDGVHHRGLDRLSGCERPHSARVRHPRRGDAPGRLEHLLARQEPQRAGRRPGRRRHQGDVAAAPGLGPLLRLPRRRDEQLVPRPGERQPLRRRSPTRPRRATTSRRTSPTRRSR